MRSTRYNTGFQLSIVVAWRYLETLHGHNDQNQAHQSLRACRFSSVKSRHARSMAIEGPDRIPLEILPSTGVPFQLIRLSGDDIRKVEKMTIRRVVMHVVSQPDTFCRQSTHRCRGGGVTGMYAGRTGRAPGAGSPARSARLVHSPSART
jgi:hypothetical protein